jgi:class 3 adenylate cyclase
MGQTIVASAEFAQQVPGQFQQRGECTVAGFSAPQKVFCLTAPQQ